MLVVHTRKKHIPKRNSQRHQPITGVETRTNSHRNKTNRILWLKTTTPWTKLIIFRNRQHVLLIQRHRQHVRSTYPHILEMLHNLASLHKTLPLAVHTLPPFPRNSNRKLYLPNWDNPMGHLPVDNRKPQIPDLPILVHQRSTRRRPNYPHRPTILINQSMIRSVLLNHVRCDNPRLTKIEPEITHHRNLDLFEILLLLGPQLVNNPAVLFVPPRKSLPLVCIKISYRSLALHHRASTPVISTRPPNRIRNLITGSTI